MAIEKLEPVLAVDAITHPRFKFFPETGEEKYHSFLGVPIIERGTPIGVLVVQTLRRRRFSPHEIRILREIATKVGPIIVTARLMEDLKSKENERREFRRRMVAAIKRLQAYEKAPDRAEAAAPGRARLNGLPAAPGFGRGRAHLLEPPVSFELVEEKRADHPEEEKRRFKRALKQSMAELDHLKERLAKRLPEFDGGIIDAHRLMLEDPGFGRKVEAAVHGGLAAEAALKGVVEGNSGVVYVNPPVDVAREYERLEREYSAFNQQLETLKHLPAETSDGRRLSLYANIGLIADLLLAHRHGAQGVGLYRTEFPFLTYREFPNEEEQYQLYARVVRGMEGRPVTIRTLDVGADKYPAYMQVPREDNPYLGWRSIRISLEIPEVFKMQLRAILRAAVLGRVRVMFPMISSVEEIRRAKELLAEAKEELVREGREFEPGVQVGMMVEVPSAVALAHQLIREVDFFSIGTNDLIQYLLAVDRNNRKVAPLYEPLHPAVLSAVHEVVQAAKGAGKWVGMCGEMAADPQCTLLLLGFGLDDLSMGPFFIPLIKRIIRSVSYPAARNIARDVLEMATVKEVKGYLFDGMKSLGIIELMEMYH